MRTSLRLLPACGSVSAMVPAHSPLYMRRMYTSRCSSVPKDSMSRAAPLVSAATPYTLRLPAIRYVVAAAATVNGSCAPPTSGPREADRMPSSTSAP